MRSLILSTTVWNQGYIASNSTMNFYVKCATYCKLQTSVQN